MIYGVGSRRSRSQNRKVPGRWRRERAVLLLMDLLARISGSHWRRGTMSDLVDHWATAGAKSRRVGMGGTKKGRKNWPGQNSLGWARVANASDPDASYTFPNTLEKRQPRVTVTVVTAHAQHRARLPGLCQGQPMGAAHRCCWRVARAECRCRQAGAAGTAGTKRGGRSPSFLARSDLVSALQLLRHTAICLQWDR